MGGLTASSAHIDPKAHSPALANRTSPQNEDAAPVADHRDGAGGAVRTTTRKSYRKPRSGSRTKQEDLPAQLDVYDGLTLVGGATLAAGKLHASLADGTPLGSFPTIRAVREAMREALHA